MRHLIMLGACYLDTILSVPYYPEEDEKLRSTTHKVRRGGNCANSLEVLQQLVVKNSAASGDSGDAGVSAHLVACLPEKGAPATQAILDSLGGGSNSSSQDRNFLHFDHCLYRAGHATPASCYILRSAQTGSRTIVNFNDLPEMTTAEFAAIVQSFQKNTSDDDDDDDDDTTWWHFEGRVPDTTLACLRHLRQTLPAPSVTISVEVEKPNREGLRALAAEADVVFYSKTWAESQGYANAAACLQGEADKCPHAQLMFCTWGADGASALARRGSRLFSTPVPSPVPASKVIDTVGAGDTFVAGILYELACSPRRRPGGRGTPSPASAVPTPEKAGAETGEQKKEEANGPVEHAVAVQAQAQEQAPSSNTNVVRHHDYAATVAAAAAGAAGAAQAADAHDAEAQQHTAGEAERDARKARNAGRAKRLDALAADDADVKQALVFAVDLASRKVQVDGFRGLV